MKGFLDLCTTNPVVENYILSSAKLQTSHNWEEMRSLNSLINIEKIL